MVEATAAVSEVVAEDSTTTAEAEEGVADTTTAEATTTVALTTIAGGAIVSTTTAEATIVEAITIGADMVGTDMGHLLSPHMANNLRGLNMVHPNMEGSLLLHRAGLPHRPWDGTAGMEVTKTLAARPATLHHSNDRHGCNTTAVHLHHGPMTTTL